MGVSDTRLNDIFPGIMTDEGTRDGVTYRDLNIASETILGSEGFVSSRFSLEECYPNPAKSKTTIHFKVNSAYQVRVELIDGQGRIAKTILNDVCEPGEYKKEVFLDDLKAGTYVCKLVSGTFKQSRKLIIVE